MIELGYEPEKLSIVLVKNADFVAGIRRIDGDNWPVGLSVSLRFNDSETTVWPASVVDTLISWNVDQVVVNALARRRPTFVQLLWDEDELELVWAQGSLRVVEAK